MITAEVLDFLVGLLRSQKRMELHGVLYDGYLPCLRVLRAGEERGLKKVG
jgi:arginine decarboxylase